MSSARLPAAIDCEHCDGLGFRESRDPVCAAQFGAQTCEACEGLGVLMVCRCCGEPTGTPEEVCDPCASDAEQLDECAHRHAHAAEVA